MKEEIKEALALEITKVIFANKDPLKNDLESAELWVNTFKEALESVNQVNRGNRPPLDQRSPFKTSY